jgi:hypothetical protein
MHVSTAEQSDCLSSDTDQPANHRAPNAGGLAPESPDRPLRPLPKECGLALIGFGMIGVLLLDPVDSMFVLVGALAFAPKLSERTERWAQRRFPRIHREGRERIDRFLDDLEKRYPPKEAASGSANRDIGPSG